MPEMRVQLPSIPFMTPQPPNTSTDFHCFEAFARRILTTPKAELMKHAPKKTTKQRAKGKGKK